MSLRSLIVMNYLHQVVFICSFEKQCYTKRLFTTLHHTCKQTSTDIRNGNHKLRNIFLSFKKTKNRNFCFSNYQIVGKKIPERRSAVYRVHWNFFTRVSGLSARISSETRIDTRPGVVKCFSAHGALRSIFMRNLRRPSNPLAKDNNRLITGRTSGTTHTSRVGYLEKNHGSVFEMRWTYVIMTICIAFPGVAASRDPAAAAAAVKITKGSVRGRILKSRNGRDFYSFTSIPYAKPPVGGLRFKPPEPIDSWDGVLDATKEPNMCVQNNHFLFPVKDVIAGDEDCLYVNVHTPRTSGKLPVMFWIHGGGFLAGHSRSELYGPDYFMDKDVVFVSFNYRLGLFGFISTEDDVIPGNYGMKDQVMALRWVRDNIGRFGGDPGRVTVFGESAGGASAGYHLLSPSSKGLFHKAILQSGTPLCNWAVSPPGLVRKRTEAVATLAGCHHDTSEDILNCLQRLSARFLVQLHSKFFEWIIHPSVLFPPVVEPCGSVGEPFICRHPITDFRQESFVPTMMGVNSGEGGLFVASLFNETSLKYPEMDTDFSRLLASLLMYKHFVLAEHLDDIGNQIKQMYFPSGKIDDHTHSNAVEMIGEGVFVTCTLTMSTKLSSPVYFYLFDYEHEFSFNKMYGKCEKSLGVSHGDEMIGLFPLKEVFPRGLNEKDGQVSKRMVDIWVKFASSTTPTVDGTDDGQAWPEFTTVEDSYFLHIDSARPKIIKNPFEERFKFWSGLPLSSRLDVLASSSSPGKSNGKNEL